LVISASTWICTGIMPASRSRFTCLYFSLTRVPSRNPPNANNVMMTLLRRSAMFKSFWSSSGVGERGLYVTLFGRL